MNPTPQSIVRKLFDELTRLPDVQRLQITLTNCYLELMTFTLAVKTCKNGKQIAKARKEFTHYHLITLLHEAGTISDDEAKFLNWFRQRRNEAAHEIEFAVTKEHLSAFKGYTISNNRIVLGPVPNQEQMPQLDHPFNLRGLCVFTVMHLWNEHLEVFVPIFKG